MKVYVIKNKQGEYQTETRDFCKNIYVAELFDDYELARCYAPKDCVIVESVLMEQEELFELRILDENEFQRYCSFKHIEPEIKGCLDREREYIKQLADTEAQNKRVLEKLDLITRSNQELEKQLAEKEKEIESLRNNSDKNIDYLIELASLIEDKKDCNIMLRALDRVRKATNKI